MKFNFVDSEDASRSFSGHGDYHGHKCLSWVEILPSQLNDGYLIQIFFVFNIFKLLPAAKVPSSSANFFVKDQLVYILRFVCLLWDCMFRISHYERSCNWINMTVVQSNYLFVGTYLDFSNPFAMLEIQKFSYTYLVAIERADSLSWPQWFTTWVFSLDMIMSLKWTARAGTYSYVKENIYIWRKREFSERRLSI